MLLDDDAEGSYKAWLAQDAHEAAGTQRSDEPVSKSSVKFCGGSPIVIGPVHSRSNDWSVSGTAPRFPLSRCEGRVASALIEAPSGSASAPRFFCRLMRFWRNLLYSEIVRNVGGL